MELTDEEMIRHLARFRVRYKGEEKTVSDAVWDFFEDAVAECVADMTMEDSFLPADYEIWKSYDQKSWAVCGEVGFSWKMGEPITEKLEDEIGDWNYALIRSTVL